MYFLLILFLVLQPIEVIKVMQRWEYLKTLETTCRIGSAEALDATNMDQVAGFYHLRSKFKVWVSKANCSFETYQDQAIGKPDANGSYNGNIGRVQRNELDFALVNIRTDAIPHDPGKPTAPLYSADIGIFSLKNGTEEKVTRDITSFLAMELPVLMYSFVSLFFLVPIIMLHDTQDEHEQREQLNLMSPIAFIQLYLRNFFLVLNLLLDQEQFSPRRVFAFVLSLFTSLFVLFAVHGILFSTVGANLVAKKLPATIDTLDDLLASNVTPVVITNFQEYEAIKSAPPGTKLAQLKQKIEQAAPNSTLTMNYDVTAENVGGMQGEAAAIIDSKKAILLTARYAEYASDCLCFLKDASLSSLSKRLHVSSETFAAGIFTGLMSNNIHPYTEKVLSYLITTMFETGHMQGIWSNYLRNFPDMADKYYPNMKFDGDTARCLDAHGRPDDDMMTHQPFSLAHLKGAFFICSVGLCLSNCFFFLEIIWFLSSPDGKKKRLARRPSPAPE